MTLCIPDEALCTEDLSSSVLIPLAKTNGSLPTCIQNQSKTDFPFDQFPVYAVLLVKQEKSLTTEHGREGVCEVIVKSKQKVDKHFPFTFAEQAHKLC